MHIHVGTAINWTRIRLLVSGNVELLTAVVTSISEVKLKEISMRVSAALIRGTLSMKAAPFDIFMKDLLGTHGLDRSAARAQNGKVARHGIGGALGRRILRFLPGKPTNRTRHGVALG